VSPEQQRPDDLTPWFGGAVAGLATGACGVLVHFSSDVNAKVTFAVLGGMFGTVFLGWIFAIAGGEGR
jgi:hypothetical protein